MPTSSLFITATDLKLWAHTREAQGDMPRLVRRLIHATVDRVLRSSMPGGDSVQSGGWDGTVLVEGGNAYVPEGASVWEFGAGKDPSGKAQKDYDKRTEDPGNVDPQRTTFIFVTPRIWENKDQWAADRMAEGKWLEVRAYDANDLEAWLELAPAVQLWIAQHLQKSPDGASDLETFWLDWSETTKPALTTTFVLAGRERVAGAVQEWLRGTVPTLALQAETPREAIAAFAAAIMELPEDEQLTYLARTAVIETAAAWTRVAIGPNGLILLPLFDVGDALTRALRAGHRVVLPLGRADRAGDDALLLPFVEEKPAMAELLRLAIAPPRAYELAVTARRSLMAFRRAITVRPEVQQPAWAKPATARALLPALLAGAWDERQAGDREAIAAISGATYDVVQETLIRWANESDAPVRRIGETWYLLSREDAWRLLAHYLTRDDLERFERVAIEVLGTPDPKFDLPPSDWWAAKGLDAKPLHTKLLRTSLAECLAMLAVRGADLQVASGITARDYAARIVATLLQKAEHDWRIWASLSDVEALPHLAEAAPDVFLAAVERSVAGDNPVLLRLFTDKDDAMFSQPQHTGLLYALEALAWSEDYFGRVVELVGELARIDPGGKYGNRPQTTLLHLFAPEHPFTTAPPKARLAAVDGLFRRQPAIAWMMLLNLFPHHFGRVMFFGTHLPAWHRWLPERMVRPSKDEIERMIGALGDRVLKHVDDEKGRWPQVIEILDRLPHGTREAVLTALEELSNNNVSDADRFAIWTALREYMQPYRARDESFPADFTRVEALYEKLEPVLDTERYPWLFSARPPIDEFQGATEERLRSLRLRQKEALETVIATSGVAGVLALIPQVGRPDTLGSVMSEVNIDDNEAVKILTDSLSSNDADTLNFGRGLTTGLNRHRGREWTESQLGNHPEWSPVIRAEVLTLVPPDRRAWALLEKENDEVQRLYWQRLDAWALPPGETAYIAEGYLKAGRAFSLIDYLAEQVRGKEVVDVALILPLLERAMKTSSVHDRPSPAFTYHFGELLDALAAAASADEESRIALLEWSILPLLTREEVKPEILHRELARNPEFFVEMVRAAHPRKQDGVAFTDDDRFYARTARGLLDSWRGTPRYDVDGATSDTERLGAWVNRARALFAEDDRTELGDRYIGAALSAVPSDDDDTWPSVAVRDIIEDVKSDALERGIEMAVFNGRGSVWKGEYEGGQQERSLAARYAGYAIQVAGGWGRTAAMLRRLADGYAADARREDDSAALWRDLRI